MKIPKLIKTLDFTFVGCSNLKTITLPDGLNKIDRAFKDCKLLEKINIPDSVLYIGEYCFENCKNLTEISIPKNVNYIGQGAFRYFGSYGTAKINFAETDGWKLCEDAVTSTDMDSAILADPLEAAKYLHENCLSKYLERK